MKASLKHMDNEMAVSPIVATLVLVVVAVVGAVAVGTIMGTFSSDVSKQASAGDVAGASQTEILIAGSTTVQPASELLAEAYTTKNPGVKVTVQAGGSGAGITSVGMGIVDIGSASRALKDSEKTDYPDLVEHRIGGSAVCAIVGSTATPTMAAKVDLLNAFNATPSFTNLTGITKAYQRSEASGTEETFAEYLGYSAKNLDALTSVAGVTGNSGMITAIGGTTNAIGFADYGFVKSATNVKALQVADGSNLYIASDSNVKAALKDKFNSAAQGTNYAQGLVRGLYYFTNGEPNSVLNNYINFARSPEGGELIADAGMFGINQILAA